jgi:hypothetical protein
VEAEGGAGPGSGSASPPTRFTRTGAAFEDKAKKGDAVIIPTEVAKAAEEARKADSGFMLRLTWVRGPRVPTPWDDLISTLAAERDVSVYCDNSAFSDNAPPELWEVLLQEPGRLVVTPRVWAELREYLARRQTHPVRIAIGREDTAIRIHNEPESGAPGKRAFDYYTGLLAARRNALEFARVEFRREQGRDPGPQEQVDLQTKVQKYFGARGLLLAKKAPGMMTDEALVYLAAENAVTTGKQTIVLTRDADVEEQFLKLLWLIDTHYRGLLLADRYRETPDAFTSRPTPAKAQNEPGWPFEEAHLIERSADMRDILPRRFHPVGIACIYADVYYSQLNFMAETEMGRLLRIKDETGGLSTDCLQGRNIHASLSPVPTGGTRDCAAVVRDKRLPVGKDGATVALLDIMQALSPVETFSDFETG